MEYRNFKYGSHRIRLYITVLCCAMAVILSNPVSADLLQRYKTYIHEPGIYRITYEDFAGNGINPADIDLSSFRIRNQGSDIPVVISNRTPDVFQPGDYVEFYGTYLHNETTYYDLYTIENAYFISWGGDTPERSPRKTVLGSEDFRDCPASVRAVTSYQDFKHLEETNYHRNFEFAQKEIIDHWTWLPILGPSIFEAKLHLDNVIREQDRFASIRILMTGLSHLPSYPDHHIMIYLNNKGIGDVTFDDQSDYLFENSKIPMSYLKSGLNKIQFCVPMDIATNDETTEILDIISLNWIEITYWRQLTADPENRITFSCTGTTRTVAGCQQLKVSGFTEPDIDFYNITKGYKIIPPAPESSAGKYSFLVQDFMQETSCQYMALPANKKSRITGLQSVEPFPESISSNPIDFIIVTHPSFLETLAPYVEFKNRQGFHTFTASTEQIYDHYNHGNFSPVAIKKFLFDMYSKHSDHKPRYVLFVGDASYDYRDFLKTGVKNFVPSYNYYIPRLERCASDNWFVNFDKYYPVPDMAIGRLPVRTTTELEAVLTKLIDYETHPVPGPWRQNTLFLAGTGNSPEDLFYHVKSDELIADYLPDRFKAQRLYLEHTSSDSNPVFDPTPDDTAKQQLFKYFNDGMFLIHFNSHGGGSIWADRNLLTLDDVPSVPGTKGRYSFILSMTCYASFFDNPHYSSLGEELLKLQDRGAIAFFGFSGRTSKFDSHLLSTAFLSGIFGEKNIVLGDLLREVYKQYVGKYGNWPFLKNATLLGDPTTRLKLPTESINLNAPRFASPGDTVKYSIEDCNFSQGNLEATLFAEQETVSTTTFEKLPCDISLTVPHRYQGLATTNLYAWNPILNTDALVSAYLAVDCSYLAPLRCQPPYPTCNDPVKVLLEAYDPSGIDTVELSWNYNPMSYDWQTIPMVRETHNLFATEYPLPPMDNVPYFYISAAVKNINGNLTFSRMKKIFVQTKSDLYIGSIRTFWDTHEKDKILFTVEIRNSGDLTANNVTVELGTLDPDNRYEKLDTKNIESIAFGAQAFVTFEWSTPVKSKDILFTIDPQSLLDEKTSVNNQLRWNSSNMDYIKNFFHTPPKPWE